MITGKNISFIYKNQRKPILENINFQLSGHKITTIIGKSGRGKTTLLRIIAQLEQRYSGEITIDGQSIAQLGNKERARVVGFVFQQYNLFAHLTVLENVMQPLRVVKGLSAHHARHKALDILRQLQIQDLREQFPIQLSGGQQQRVALARAISMEPKLLLLDEPTAALDAQTVKQFMLLLQQLKERGKSIVIVSHNSNFVEEISDEVYELSDTLVKIRVQNSNVCKV